MILSPRFRKKLGLLILPFALWMGGEQEAAAAGAIGKAVSASGNILIRNDNAGKTGQPAMRKLKTGDDILQGDVINTSSDASAKLLLTDKTVLDLGGSTLFKVDEFKMHSGSDRNVGMTMSYGKMRAAVNTPVGPKGKYNVRTKTATMGVRGTEFIIATDLGEVAPPKGNSSTSGATSAGASAEGRAAPSTVKTQITVVEGKVEVSDNTAPKKPPVAVKQGEQITTVAEVVGDKAVRKPAEAPAPKVVELSQEQMKTVVQETKVEDKTFKQAVVIDTSGMSGPTTGVSTLSEVGSTVFAASTDFTPPTPNQLGTPGTFGPAANPIQTVIPGMPINLTVVFKK